MKKTILFLAIAAVLSSCEVFNNTMRFKVIGSGTFTIGYSDNGGSTTFYSSEKEFTREMQTDELWVLTAQSNSGTGVRVEAYIGKELVKSNSASGYGVASISGTY